MRLFHVSVLAGVALILLDGTTLAGPPESSEKANSQRLDWQQFRQLPGLLHDLSEWTLKREFTRMVLGLADGSVMSGKGGWWGPGQSRYNWKWLASRCDRDGDGKVSRDEFPATDPLFERLDRDRDGYLSADDLDWSANSPFVRQAQQASMLFYQVDGDSNGRISRAEWERLFNRLAKDKGFITQDDVRDLFQPAALMGGKASPKKEKAPKEGPKKAPQNAGPSKDILIRGLLAGELGSMMEGPHINHKAPNFKLATHDGKQQYSLAEFRGQKPVVLIFGSFT